MRVLFCRILAIWISVILSGLMSPVHAQAGCNYSITPTKQTFSSAGGKGTIAITTAPGCGWILLGQPDWLTISSARIGSGNGTVSYTVTSTASGRSDTLGIATTTFIPVVVQTFTVTQEGPPADKPRIYFAQLGNGGGITSDLVLTNPSATSAATGRIEFFSNDGLPLQVGFSGAPPAGAIDFMLPPLGAQTFSTDGQGPVLAGSARVTSDIVVGGVVKFSIPGVGIAGVGESQPVTGFVIPVRRKANGINSGIAIQSVESFPVTVTLTLRDKQGRPVSNAERVLANFAAGGHLAQFIDELFPNVLTGDFEGTLLAQASGGKIAATALELGPQAGQFTTLPVTPSK
ncbi:MAG TPA: BACON domain-containing protein [Acidobacteriota bacterium]